MTRDINGEAERAAPRTESGGAWARMIADAYSRIALGSPDPQRSEANAAAASKYYGIADRLDRALPADEGAQP